MSDALQVKRQVNVKVIVTPAFKAELVAELDEAAQQTQKQLEQLEYAARHYLAELQRQDLNKALEARREIDAERQRLDRLQKEVLERKEQVAQLADGSEYLRGTLESYADLKPGDNFDQVLGGATLVVKDGVVTEIRNGQ